MAETNNELLYSWTAEWHGILSIKYKNDVWQTNDKQCALVYLRFCNRSILRRLSSLILIAGGRLNYFSGHPVWADVYFLINNKKTNSSLGYICLNDLINRIEREAFSLKYQNDFFQRFKSKTMFKHYTNLGWS